MQDVENILQLRSQGDTAASPSRRPSQTYRAYSARREPQKLNLQIKYVVASRTSLVLACGDARLGAPVWAGETTAFLNLLQTILSGYRRTA